MATERLQKILAQAGIASRRKAEELIQEGLVTINGKVAKVGDKADLMADAIKVEGKLIHKVESLVYLAFNKPKGVIATMNDPEGRPTIAEFLGKVKVKVHPIGRLNFNSEGLMLLTNDGELTEKIQKSDEFPRVYQVKVKGKITSEYLTRLERGARMDNKFVKPHSVRIKEELNKKTMIEVVFTHAANTDVKAYFETRGFLVEKITRTAFGNITLHGLAPGQYRIIPKTKFAALYEQPELGIKAIELRNEKERAILPADIQAQKREERLAKVGRISTGPRSSMRTPRGDASRRTSAITPAGEGRTGGITRRPSSRDISMPDRGDRFERKPRTGAFADRKPRSDSGDRKPYSPKPRTGFGDRKPRGDFADRKPRSEFGDRKPSGDRKPRGDFGDRKPAGGFGDRKPRTSSFGDRKPSGPRSPRPRSTESGGSRPITVVRKRER